MQLLEEKNIHRLFEATLVLKALHSALEIAGGLLLYFASGQAILAVAEMLTQEELVDDPHDLIANILLHGAQAFAVTGHAFAAFYLLSHGVVKLFLIGAIWMEKKWAYPAFMLALSALICYQCYRLSQLWSAGLLALTIFDLAVLALTVHEYRFRLAHGLEQKFWR